MARFQISGLIVAARLPQAAFSMFDCTIEPTQAPVSWPDVRRPPLGFVAAPWIAFAVVETLPPHIKVQARYLITTDVEAASLDEALSLANERFGRFLSAIAFSSNPLVQGMVVITGWRELAADGAVAQGGEAGTSMGFEPVILAPFDGPTEQSIRGLERLAARDGATQSLLVLWSEAERSNLLGFSNADKQEVLIRYAHVLEKIGKRWLWEGKSRP